MVLKCCLVVSTVEVRGHAVLRRGSGDILLDAWLMFPTCHLTRVAVSVPHKFSLVCRPFNTFESKFSRNFIQIQIYKDECYSMYISAHSAHYRDPGK